MICVDPRLSNTGAKADFWLAPWPGTEPVMLLAIARLLIEHGTWQREFVRRWVNWETFLAEVRPDLPQRVRVGRAGPARPLRRVHASSGPSASAASPATRSARSPRSSAAIPTKLASHTWRAAGAGNLGGWQVARCLFFLNVLTGSVGTEGGTSGNGWNKFVADPFKPAPPVDSWNELTWPIEYPLAYHEMSMLLPHFLLDGRGKLDTYFSRVYNPVWTNPDGFSWLEALKDETRIECHVALTPTWSETAWFADYVLPMGVGAERHDIASFETHAGRWIGFRQPVLRRYAELNGDDGRARSGARTSSTPARCGRRTSSGSTCRGASIPTARSASGSGSRATSTPALPSVSTSTTGGSSPTASPGSPRRRPPPE